MYEYVEAHKRDDETFSDAVARLTRRSSISELAGLLNSADVEAMRDAIDEADDADAVAGH